MDTTMNTNRETKMENTHQGWRIAAALLVLIGALGVSLVFLWIFPRDFRADFDRFSSEAFDSAFLSMYPIDTYEEEEFAVRYGGNTIIAQHQIRNEFTLKCYLWKIERTKQNVNNIFLGIQPEKIAPEELTLLLQTYPQYHFQVTLPHPSLEYWTQLSEKKCDSKLQAYRDCITVLLEQPNVSAYFFGSSEWMIANPDNYENDSLVNAGVARSLVHLCNEELIYYLNAFNGTAPVDELAELINRERNTPAEYINLSGKQIIFFGDSVIGNFTNTTSIPNVTGALTKADCFNLGYGGTPAAPGEEGGMGLVSIVNAFLEKDATILPAESQASIGLNEYLAKGETFKQPYCFVINYGLNDYYTGAPISSADPYDPLTYTGAFRVAVRALQEAYPESRILVITPNFTSYYNNGMDATSAHGHILEDYVNALIALSAELDIELLDNFHELDIHADNHWELLSDGCHPNETGRFLMGKRIADSLK